MRASDGGTQCGFSLIELLVAMALLLIVLGGVFEALDPSRDMSLSGAEAIDLQQRVRVAADTISRELRAAGNGTQQGNRAGPLIDAWAPIVPFRRGRRSPDPVGTVKTDTLTLLRVVTGAAQTTLAAGFVAQSGTVMIAAGPGCPPASASCGFRTGTDVVIFDGTGAYDTFSVTAVAGNLLTLQHNMSAGTTYGVGATIAEVTSTTLFLKTDPVTAVSQLVTYNGGAGSDAPIVDNVTRLEFTMFGIADPPTALAAPTDPLGPWTSYGPPPPALTVATTAYPPGENCVFTLDALGNAVPRLGTLGAPGTLVPLTPAMLRDGPWCPDALNANRYDADLLRVRQVSVVVRAEAVSSAVRGASGSWFSRAGTSISARRFVGDREVQFAISPRGFGAGR